MGGSINSVGHLSWLLGHAIRAGYFVKGVKWKLNYDFVHSFSYDGAFESQFGRNWKKNLLNFSSTLTWLNLFRRTFSRFHKVIDVFKPGTNCWHLFYWQLANTIIRQNPSSQFKARQQRTEMKRRRKSSRRILSKIWIVSFSHFWNGFLSCLETKELWLKRFLFQIKAKNSRTALHDFLNCCTFLTMQIILSLSRLAASSYKNGSTQSHSRIRAKLLEP